MYFQRMLRGPHYLCPSGSREREDKRKLAAEMAGNPFPVQTQFRQMIKQGAKAKSLPDPAAVYRRRGKARADERNFGGSTERDFEEFVRGLTRTGDSPAWKFYADLENSIPTEHVVVVRCNSLISEGARFATRVAGRHTIREAYFVYILFLHPRVAVAVIDTLG